ncbi:DUF721 domain-containing protein [Pectinatus sottacetonis]|uniref:DUF721 domain-containing protein n=1 Tax=Pectinatus sottacetonis TaxID=1002795 RepID=UPI0018C6DA5E|nr:DUF721 domain-containing protein [Pectinatus sottacetonis]
MVRRKKKYNDFKTVGQIIPRAIKHLSNSPEYKFYLIKFYWEDIVGKEIAEHAVPKHFAFGVLYIGTSSSVWANNLLYMKLDIINKINDILKYRLIKDIKFTYGKMGNNKNIPVKIEERKDIKRILANMVLSEQEKIVIEKKCNSVKDKDLAEKIKKVLSISKKIYKVKKMKKWHKCKMCGTLCPENETYCSNCRRKVKNNRAAKIRNILMTKPWARYGEIKSYVEDCTQEMVNDARASLVQRMAINLRINSYNDIQAKTLVMLYKALPPEQINEKIVKKNINYLKYDLKFDEMKKLSGKKGE